jgi:phytoene synthase
MMARIMKLPKEADPAAQMLGRAFQYINFIRDIAEDNELGRTYIPATELKAAGLKNLTLEEAKQKPHAFAVLIRKQLEYYTAWQAEGEAGFSYIPKRYRVAIAAASDMYAYTAEKIAKDPHCVFQYKVKPSRFKIIRSALYHLAFS